MSLADHWEGKFLEEGWHVVTVTGAVTFVANSGNTGVNFEVTDSQGRKMKSGGFMLLKQSLWRLANFAKACGMTQDEARRYDPMNAASHRMLINRRLKVLVTKGEKYNEITDFSTLAVPGKPAPVSQPPPVPASVLASAEEPQEHFSTDQVEDYPPPITEEESIPDDSSIPF